MKTDNEASVWKALDELNERIKAMANFSKDKVLQVGEIVVKDEPENDDLKVFELILSVFFAKLNYVFIRHIYPNWKWTFR